MMDDKEREEELTATKWEVLFESSTEPGWYGTIPYGHDEENARGRVGQFKYENRNAYLVKVSREIID